MDNEIEPVAGNWYHNLENGELFQVVAVDESEDLVELQHFEGEVEEVAMNTWRSIDVVAAEAPEDWTGPMDDVERDDLGYDQPATTDTARRDIAQDQSSGAGNEDSPGGTAERQAGVLGED